MEISNGKSKITRDTTENQRVARDYVDNLYAAKQRHLEEKDTFFNPYNLPSLI